MPVAGGGAVIEDTEEELERGYAERGVLYEERDDRGVLVRESG